MASTARFRTIAAGRRSGKTERAKRHLVMTALEPPVDDAIYVAGAPTYQQAKRIFWEDLVALSPPEFVSHVSHGELTIRYETGARIMVVGFDRPQRIEGIGIDGGVFDEYAAMRKEAYSQTIRPALSTPGRPPGWAWFTGRPRGRNHFWEMYESAKTTEDWEAFHWTSATIVDPAEIEAAKRDMDELTYAQEYEATFLSFAGRAYYAFERETHAAEDLIGYYDKGKPLLLCFDFNVEPGVCEVAQEHTYVGTNPLVPKEEIVTMVLGEVHIPRNSNTPAVCRKIAQDWRKHQGKVLCYGDATGGARGSAKVSGSDWDLIRDGLTPVFGGRLQFHVPMANPAERTRVNSLNARIKTTDGKIRLLVCPKHAPNLVRDLEGVTLLEGGSGELDKKSDMRLTHASDSVGYYCSDRHPLVKHRIIRTELY